MSRLGRFGSVRARTTTLAVVLVASALVLGSVALVLTLERSLTRSGDDLSRSRAGDLASLVTRGNLSKTLTNVGDDSIAQVVTEDGRVLAASPTLAGEGPISAFTPSGDTPVVRTMREVPDDDETEDYRVWALRQPTADGVATVYVGTSLESAREVATALTRSLLVGIPILVAMLGLAMWVLVGRTLRPVENIRSEVAEISHQQLDRRVPVAPHRDEVSRLATTMNDMLARLESASIRQRDFVANASHELQSPISAFRAQLEVALAHPDLADWPTTAKELADDSDRMERLVRDLLFLAREDGAVSAPGRDMVDLDDVVLEEVTRLRGGAAAEVDTSRVTAAPVRGSREELSRLVRNLLENARSYAAGAITVAVAQGPEGVLLEVTDDGPGVAVGDRDKIFDRFFRGDESRSRATGGSGLGLAIARTIAERHGGTLGLADIDRGTTFVVHLPNP